MDDLDDIIDAIQDEKLERARTNPIHVIGLPSGYDDWYTFYTRFWSTDEGKAHLRSVALKRQAAG